MEKKVKKIEDKLRALKNSMPEYPDHLDARILKASTKPVIKKKWYQNPRILIPQLTAAFSLIVITIFIAQNVGNKPLENNGTPSSPEANLPAAGSEDYEEVSTDAPGGPSQTPSEPPQGEASQTPSDPAGEAPLLNINFQASSTSSVLLPGLTAADGSRKTEEDVVLVTSADALTPTINSYIDPFHDVLNEKVSGLDVPSVFNEHVLLIVPFIYASSEQNISVQGVYLNVSNNETRIVFNIYSEEFNDADINVMFYFIEIAKDYAEDLSTTTFSVAVLNTFNYTNRSVYYG